MNDKYNASHAQDPTAFAAIQRESTQSVNREAEHLIRIVKAISEISGFELIGRIPIRHLRSGREFR